MDELHGQIMTLQAVKTGGDLMTHLKTKMKDISDRVQKTTIEIVDRRRRSCSPACGSRTRSPS